MIRAAIFARVSTRQQNTDRQIHDLYVEAERQGWKVVGSFREVVSGTKRTKERPELTRLLTSCRAGQIDRVIVTEVSRLGRRTSEVLAVIDELTELKICVYALNYRLETLLPTGKRNPMAGMLFTFLSEFAQLERETTVERINSGLDAARRKGKVLGRKPGTVQDEAKTLERYPAVVKRLRAGGSVRDVAKLCEVSTKTVQKVKSLLSQE